MKRALMTALVALASLAALVPRAEAAGGFSHAALGTVFGKYVDAKGLVDYKGILADRATFDSYIAALAKDSPTNNAALFPSKNDKYAYYINAYNALAVKGVIDRPGIKTVDSVKVDFFALTKYTLGGAKISLYTLENDVVRKQFNDPRAHFALNCQSAGCPRMPKEVFEPATLDAQLDAYSKEFCADKKKVNVDSTGTVNVSQIFEWYSKDFDASGGPIGFCNKYGTNLPVGAKVKFIQYDWALSAQPGRNP